MRRWIFLMYGVFCYLLFLAVYAWMAGFVGNFLVPNSMDASPAGSLSAIGWDLMLVMVFGLQHSIMARPGFKRMWTRFVPEAIERSTYCLFSCLALGLLLWQWQAIGPTLWDVQTPALRTLLWSLFAIGWFAVPGVSLLINHFDLFGLRQVWLFFRGRKYESLPFRTPMLYSRVRHPLYLAWTLAFWATPTMTLGHAILAGTMTLYMIIAVQFEERDLVGHFGKEYRDYQKQVPMFIPRLGELEASPAKENREPVSSFPEHSVL